VGNCAWRIGWPRAAVRPARAAARPTSSKSAATPKVGRTIVVWAAAAKSTAGPASSKSAASARFGKTIVVWAAAAKTTTTATTPKSTTRTTAPAHHTRKTRGALRASQGIIRRLARANNRLKDGPDDFPFLIRCVNLAFDAIQPSAASQRAAGYVGIVRRGGAVPGPNRA
jgi:hypothetical protein